MQGHFKLIFNLNTHHATKLPDDVSCVNDIKQSGNTAAYILEIAHNHKKLIMRHLKLLFFKKIILNCLCP